MGTGVGGGGCQAEADSESVFIVKQTRLDVTSEKT